jgi:hypothetical protein
MSWKGGRTVPGAGFNLRKVLKDRDGKALSSRSCDRTPVNSWITESGRRITKG